jgi:hypothetical protein
MTDQARYAIGRDIGARFERGEIGEGEQLPEDVRHLADDPDFNRGFEDGKRRAQIQRGQI